MTIAVDLGRKTTKQTKLSNQLVIFSAFADSQKLCTLSNKRFFHACGRYCSLDA